MFSERATTWKNRLTNFAGGEHTEESYQVTQAKIAIAKGGLFGKGPGNSTQRNFLPHSYSDFIYSYKKRTKLLHNIYKEDKNIQRLFVQFLLQFNKEYFWNHVEEFDARSFIDLMWYLNFDDID